MDGERQVVDAAREALFGAGAGEVTIHGSGFDNEHQAFWCRASAIVNDRELHDLVSKSATRGMQHITRNVAVGVR